MVHAVEAKKSGAQKVTIVEIDLDTCLHDWGVPPCAASGAVGSECYDTRSTCQDRSNYSATPKTLRFSMRSDPVLYGENILPFIDDVDTAPSKLKKEGGLGEYARATIQFVDAPHHDRGVDDYVANRNYIASDQGTYWGKLIARNPYYAGRALRIKTGYLSENGLDLANDFEVYHYVLKSISQPDSRGRVTVVAMDPLSLSAALKSQGPEASDGVLLADIEGTPASFAIAAGKGAGYGARQAVKYVRINSEIMQVSLSTDTFTIINRGMWGTEPDDHAAGDTVQECLYFESVRVDEVVRQLCVDWAGIDASFITFADWQDEADIWLDEMQLSNIISEPTGVDKLLSQITRELRIRLWWGDREQALKFKAQAPITPDETLTTYSDDVHIKRSSGKPKTEDKLRLSQVWIYNGVRNYTEPDESKNFHRIAVAANDEGSADKHGTEQVKILFSRWLPGMAAAEQAAGWGLRDYTRAPRTFGFHLDVKDHAIRVGQRLIIDSRMFQAVDGSNFNFEAECLAIDFIEKDQHFVVDVLEVNPSGTHPFYITSDSQADYDASSEEDQRRLGFISDEDGLMSNGDAGAVIV